jgi:hypothetical protein
MDQGGDIAGGTPADFAAKKPLRAGDFFGGGHLPPYLLAIECESAVFGQSRAGRQEAAGLRDLLHTNEEPSLGASI